jgi:phosphoribosylformylglycinamidine (FGAM) synthase-like amidotransferase family enzyme
MAVVSGVGLVITNPYIEFEMQDATLYHHYMVLQITKQPAFDMFPLFCIGHPQQIPAITYASNTNKMLHTIFAERNNISVKLDTSKIPYRLDSYVRQPYVWNRILYPTDLELPHGSVSVAIVRDEGSNSHREMAAVWLQIPGVMVVDYTITELLDASMSKLEEFMNCVGFCFVGGFSYGDVLGSGKATAYIMKTRLQSVFNAIFANPTKFVLGVCNGCQILTEYGLFGNIHMEKNASGKFDSWYLPVVIGSGTLGIWNAHGEGRFTGEISESYDIFGKYISDYYPMNPNGSMYNMMGVCSKVAKHIAVMPHPERSIFQWQNEYIPPEILEAHSNTPYTPWITLFVGLLDARISTGVGVRDLF